MLTCADKIEAEKIVQSLLKKKLVVCAKSFPVNSVFYWKGEIDKAKEIFVVMDSSEELFEKVEKEVRRLHSYETPNLSAIPISKTSRGIIEWLKEGLK